METEDDLAWAYEPLSRAELARRAQVTERSVELLEQFEVLDLHLETYIPPRLWGYDLLRRHGSAPFGGRFFGHLDFPRVLDARLAGAMWSIATNIARTGAGRLRALRANVEALSNAMVRTGGRIRLVRTHRDYVEARNAGAHAALLAIQGGNAFQEAEDGAGVIADQTVTRVTLVHLSDSVYGATSSPFALRRAEGLTQKGRALVAQLNASRTFVDLAHASRQAFWDAVEVHDRTQPLLVTHTGADAVCPSWRNLDDKQIRAVADTGGVVGIIFHGAYLRRRGGPRDGRMVVEHLEHVIRVAGEDAAAIGSDFDGLIIPSPDLRDGALAYARLVQHMQNAGWKEARIEKVLGQNFLRAFKTLRP